MTGRSWSKRIIGLVFAGAAVLASCTTYIRPVTCTGGRYRCNEGTDVKFCEYEAVAVEGADCAEVGLVASKHFCVVTRSKCIGTNYEVKDRNCKVLQYTAIRQWPECSADTPTFAGP